MSTYQFLPGLFLRTPFYSFSGYDLDRLPEVLGSPVFRTAVWLASPAFYRALEAKGFDFGALTAKEKHTLAKYYNRMCFRPVPFGSFAAFTVLEWGDGSTVRLCGDDRALLHVLPDHAGISKMGQPGPNAAEMLMTNPLLYQAGKELRFFRTLTSEKGRYRFSLDAFPVARFYRQLFVRFKKGPVLRELISRWISGFAGCTAGEAEAQLDYLLEIQLLFSSAREALILPQDRDGQLPGAQHLSLTHAARLLGRQKTEAWYAAAERSLEKGGPGSAEQQELATAVSLLQKLALPVENSDLQTFITRFRQRFDQQKVPLLTALDPDTGISYGNPPTAAGADELMDGIVFPEKTPPGHRMDWTPVHHTLLRLWPKESTAGRGELHLGPGDLNGLASSPAAGLSPSSISLMFRETGDHLLLESAGGITATALIGRFTVFSDDVYRLCKEIVARETAAHPDILFADIGQLSDTHVDNINRRAAIYPYELPLNVFSQLPKQAQIEPADLLLSLRDGELILESRSLGKRVVPRLSTAYNYRHTELPVFRFLCDLQFAGFQSDLSIDLARFFPGLSFYPRVVSGRTILARATWHFSAPDLEAVITGDTTGLHHRLRGFRQAHQLPQRVTLGAFDQELLFDLGDKAECLFFAECIRGLEKVTLREYLLPGRTVKTGNKPLGGQYIAFLHHQTRVYEPLLSVAKPVATIARDFPPGSEWLYLRIHCTPQTADLILSEVLFPFVRRRKRQLTCWFFIRYQEGGNHLRLRLKTAQPDDGGLLAALNTALAARGYQQMVADLQADTYRRELERYGTLIDLAEQQFAAGSELACCLLQAAKKSDSLPDDFSYALWTAWELISCWYPLMTDRLAFTQSVESSLFLEFSGDKQLRTGVDRKYQILSSRIEDLLKGKPQIIHPGGTRTALRRLVMVTVHIREESLRVQDIKGGHALLADLVHMQMNRAFRTDQRRREFLVYACLCKFLRSEIARSRKKP